MMMEKINILESKSWNADTVSDFIEEGHAFSYPVALDLTCTSISFSILFTIWFHIVCDLIYFGYTSIQLMSIGYASSDS